MASFIDLTMETDSDSILSIDSGNSLYSGVDIVKQEMILEGEDETADRLVDGMNASPTMLSKLILGDEDETADWLVDDTLNASPTMPSMLCRDTEDEAYSNIASESDTEGSCMEDEDSDGGAKPTEENRVKSLYDDDAKLPVYSWEKPHKHYTVEELTRILVIDKPPQEKICSKQPMHVHHNVSFVVNLESLDEAIDVRADGNGVWKRRGSPVAFASVHRHRNTTSVFKRSRSGKHHYKLSRTYYRHACSQDFTRIITTVHDAKGQLQPLAFVQYSFDRHEHPIQLKPHGNSKGKQPFTRTKPSTIHLLKSSMETKTPRKVLREVEQLKGGVMGASSACDLPRNRQQVHNLKYSAKNCSGLENQSNDILAHVMQMCKESADSQSVFVRSVEAAPEPMCVLATDQQLVDLERFCTGNPSCVLCIDPTFNLGPFNVTPTAYRNLLVETTKGNNNPIVLGPILMHQTKTFRRFHHFASTLIRLNPKLVGLRSYGSDGEPELIKAFSVCFPNAVQLRCSNHIRQNIKDKLRTLNISQGSTKEFLADIFGRQIDTHFEAGLVDSESELSFKRGLEVVKAKWDNLELSYNPTVKPQFHAWFCQYKADEIIKCVLPQARHLAGCRDPSRLFTTNNSESLNHVIKQEVSWKENQLPNLLQSLKAIVSDHVSCLEKAVIGRGEWHFTKQYENLVVTEQRWFSQMSDSAKKLHMSKVNRICPLNCPSSSTSHSSTLSSSLNSPLNASHSSGPSSSNVHSCLVDRSNSKPVLSVPVEESGLNVIADCTLRGMWAKAEKLVISDGHILQVPWSSDHMARLVKSSTSVQPHLVTRNSKNMELFCCDKNCQMFKGFSLCSHVLAAAHDNGRLRSFLDHMKEVHVNLSSIANHGLPTGAGRKGDVAKQKRKRALPSVETRSVRPCLSHQAVGQEGSHQTVGQESSHQTVGQLQSSRQAVGQQSSHQAVGQQSSRQAVGQLQSGRQAVGQQSSHQAVGQQSSRQAVGQLQSSHQAVGQQSSRQAVGQQSGHQAVGQLQSSHQAVGQQSSRQAVGQLQSSRQAVGQQSSRQAVGQQSSHQAVGQQSSSKNPFVLKFKNNHIKVCQSCRMNYEGQNNTLDLLVSRAERRMISNLSTGAQFLGKESNSHYHLKLCCLKVADPTFQGPELVVPETIKEQLTSCQKAYLAICFNINI